MKHPLTTALLLSLSLFTACADSNLPTQGSVPDASSINGNITPFPKGPKELDGIRMPLSSEAAPTLPQGASLDKAQRQSATNTAADANIGFDGGAGASADDLSIAPESPTEPQATTAPTAAPTAAPTPAATSEPSASSSPTPIESASADPIAAVQNFFYFSYDDSASTAGVEQTKFALSRSNPVMPNPSWIRPWEFLNYEKFETQNPQSTGTFQVSMGLWQHNVAEKNAYDLGVQVKTPTVTKAERQNVVLTLLLDVSGSMNMASVSLDDQQDVPSLLAVAKAGLRKLPEQLKAGDVVNFVTFSNTAKTTLENWQYNGDDSEWQAMVNGLKTEGGTNLNLGLEKAYNLAQNTYAAGKTNRVMMLTDAFANAGTVNADVIAQSTKINDLEGIYFSGLGFGFGFNDSLLNTLTEAGKGSYGSVISTTDAERAFGEGFISLTQIAARNVRFRLDYPASLARTVSAAEQSSQVASEVDPIHFAANSSQFFLERFTSDNESSVSGDFKLTIAYTDPTNGEQREEVLSMNTEQLRNKELSSIKDARMVTLLTQLIQGKVTVAEAKTEMESLLQGHTSSLSSEYQKYIETWIGLNEK